MALRHRVPDAAHDLRVIEDAAYLKAVEDSAAYLNNRMKVRIRHPSFGYVKSVERGKELGSKVGAVFTWDVKEAAEWTCSELRAAQDANNNGTMALLVASYGGLTFEQVVTELKKSIPRLRLKGEGDAVPPLRHCTSCKASIAWLRTSTGRTMPVDWATVRPGDQEYDKDRHISHFATCPNADKHRKPRPPA